MITAKIPLELIELNLDNRVVSIPSSVHFSQSEITINFDTEDGAQLSFEFALTGNKLRLVLRDMKDNNVCLSAVCLHDYAGDNSGQMRITGEREYLGE